MAPSAVETTPIETPIRSKAASTPTSKPAPAFEHREPLKTTGVLDQYEWFDTTPVIGREFPTANLVDWFNAPNSDELIRDLAITSKHTNEGKQGNRELTFISPTIQSQSVA